MTEMRQSCSESIMKPVKGEEKLLSLKLQQILHSSQIITNSSQFGLGMSLPHAPPHPSQMLLPNYTWLRLIFQVDISFGQLVRALGAARSARPGLFCSCKLANSPLPSQWISLLTSLFRLWGPGLESSGLPTRGSGYTTPFSTDTLLNL